MAMTTTLETTQPIRVSSISMVGIRIDALTLAQVLALFDDYIKNGDSHQVSFVNAHSVYECAKSIEMKNLINQSELVLADGISIVWGSRILGNRLPGRLAGPDVMESLCAQADQKGYRVFLMGTSWGNLDRLKKAVMQRWPNIPDVGVYSPPMADRLREDETQKILARLHSFKPDILFVGMSCPKQERWIAENKSRLDVPVCLAVGAAFDFMSGKIPRAPKWLRDHGLEWLHRLWCEPRRLWKRYLLGNSVFIFLLMREKLRRRFQKGIV